MAKREKILVVMAIVALIYGVYNFFFASVPKKNSTRVVETFSGADFKKPNLQKSGFQKQGKTDADSFVTDVITKIVALDNSKKDMYIIKKAETAWVKNPFAKSDLPLNIKIKEKIDQVLSFENRPAYSGYIAVGRKKMAIINGMEYVVGDTIVQTDYIIKSISSIQVVAGSAGKIKIILPLEETDRTLSDKTGKKNEKYAPLY